MTLYIIKYKYESEIIGVWTDKALYESALQYFIQCECEGSVAYFKENYDYGTLEELDINFNYKY
jgi:hypothetical protein